MLMSSHLLATLIRLANGNTTGQAGWHYGSLRALVKRGCAETFNSAMGTEYRATPMGNAIAKEDETASNGRTGKPARRKI